MHQPGVVHINIYLILSRDPFNGIRAVGHASRQTSKQVRSRTPGGSCHAGQGRRGGRRLTPSYWTEEKICFIRWRDVEGYDTIPTTYSSFLSLSLDGGSFLLSISLSRSHKVWGGGLISDLPLLSFSKYRGILLSLFLSLSLSRSGGGGGGGRFPARRWWRYPGVVVGRGGLLPAANGIGISCGGILGRRICGCCCCCIAWCVCGLVFCRVYRSNHRLCPSILLSVG